MKSRPIALLTFALLAAAGTALAAEPGGAPAAPPLAATLLDGSHFTLAQSRGHVVLVNYWASWCGPCRQELPVFAAYYRAHHAEGFDVLAINVDDSDTRARALEFAKTLPFPVALVAEVRTGDYARGCQPGGGLLSMVTPCLLPHSYILDRSGALVIDRRAGFDGTEFAAAIDPLLKPTAP